MQPIKQFTAISFAAVLAYFQPIHSLLVAISALFVVNFVFGLITGITTNNERFCFRKAFACVGEASVFLVILSAIFFIGDHLHVQGQALQAISTVTYALIYFYVANILKNLNQLMPWSKTLAFLQRLVSFELLPKMNRFLEKGEEDALNHQAASHDAHPA